MTQEAARAAKEAQALLQHDQPHASMELELPDLLCLDARQSFHNRQAGAVRREDEDLTRWSEFDMPSPEPATEEEQWQPALGVLAPEPDEEMPSPDDDTTLGDSPNRTLTPCDLS